MKDNKPFEGYKIIELASVLAGPSVGMFFAELGATVIKIENKKTNGDVTRSWKSKHENENENFSAYFASVNWGKESLFLDFSNQADYEQIKELIQDADVVISNFKKGDDFKFQLDTPSIKAINSKIIIGKISGYGNENEKVAYDLVLQAESGFMSMNGTKESGPTKMPVALIDVLAAHHLKEGILVALLQKNKTGKGAVVEVSLFDSAVASLVNQAANYLFTNQIPQLSGSLHPNIAPYGETFLTSDNKLIVLAVGNDKQFETLCKVLKLKQINSDSLFSTNIKRVKNRTELQKILAEEILKHKSESLNELFIQNKIPAGIIKDLNEVISNLNSSYFLNFNNSEKKVVKSVVFKLSEL